jgi:hypothetical protein
MPDFPIKVDGEDSFVYGANSFLSPTKLGPGQYVMSSNTTNRGGVIQTRPGTASLIFDEDITGTNIQGITMFKPSSGPVSLVWMIDGLVYYSPFPFKTKHQLEDLQFSPYSKYATWAQCIQSTDYTDGGILITLDKPKTVLIIQDGATRAAYWDGSTAAHINPTPSGSEFTVPDRDGTPGGLWMKWSNNRLWVSRDDQVFASDIGNPLKFTEAQYINEARAFYLPGKCTGIVETTDQQGILCFTAESGTFLRSSIQDRTAWLSTADFQKTVLPSIGCTAPRSLVNQYGLVWWMTTKGLISLDDALRLNISSRINIADQEMAASKAEVYKDISTVCGSFYENYLVQAVPHAHKINTRVHVLDQAPLDDGYTNSWPSYWDGWWRPVEFARGVVANRERVFCISRDTDDVIRIWEFFKQDRTDNGVPITSHVQARLHLFGDRDYKEFQHAEVEAVGLSGDVSFLIAAGGLKGAFQSVGTKEVVATKGQVYAETDYGNGEDDSHLYGSRPQTRIILTTDSPDPSDCNSECIESANRGMIDKALGLWITWSGIAGISAYRIFARSAPNAHVGTCEEDETTPRVLTPDGCGFIPDADEEVSGSRAFTEYESEQTYEHDDGSATRSATSRISQADADRKALMTARFHVLSDIGELV